MKRILLPTDFSENSWNAIQYAMELYKEDVCTFYLLNAYTPMLIEPVNPMGSTAVTKAMLDDSAKKCRIRIGQYAEKNSRDLCKYKASF